MTDPTPTTDRKWHQKKPRAVFWSSIVLALLAGMLIAAPANDAADKEAKTAKANALKDARTEADGITADAELTREKLKQDADTLRREIATLKDDRAATQKRLKEVKAELNGAEADLKASTFDGTGTYLVGTDVRPGTYRADASTGCYWERKRDLEGGLNSIVENENTDGPVVLKIASSDAAIEVTNCGEFKRIAG